MAQRELTSAEITEFLYLNPDVNARVLAHQRIVDAGQWDQVRLNSPGVFGVAGERLPVPTKGLAVKDATYGVVVIFPDAAGRLHYNAFVDPALLNSDITKPPFESPTGNSFAQTWEDIKTSFGKILMIVAVLAALYVGARFIQAVKS